MSLRGIVLALAGFCGCATALNAQPLPPCLFGQTGSGCSVGSSFSFDLGQFFQLGEIASIIDGLSTPDFTVTFTYSLQLTSGTLPPGLSLSPSGLISGTFSASGDYKFIIT